MADRGLQGWSADPFGLHQERYFSAGHPTKLVRDGTVERFEAPPSDTFVPADAVTAADTFGRPTAAAPGGFAATTPPPFGASGPRPRDPGYPLGLRYPPDPGSAPGRPRRRHLGLLVAVTAIAAASIVGVMVGKGSRSPTSPDQALTLTSPVAFVTHSAQQTLAEHTVDVTMSGTIQVSAKNVAVDGTGQMNFDTNAMTFDLHAAGAGVSVEEKMLMAGGNAYFALSANGLNFSQLTGGRSWIQLPVQQSATDVLAGSDPASSLSLLEQQGSTVRPLGSKTIDGVGCTGYAVTPSKQAMIAETRSENAKLGLPSTVTDQELQQMQYTTPPTVTIWSDAQGLVREISVNMQLNLQGSATAGDLVMDFSHYGAPVSITAPPPSDTISLTSFLQNLGSKGT